MPIERITSDNILSDIDRHFKVSAGPGAGKTHWLVNHIKNVLHHSDKLFRTRKIACITYTNIAVDTILKRLGTSSEQVEVSTIHSFLYTNVIKPYAFFISKEFGLNISEIDGHDEINISHGLLRQWTESTNQIYLINDRDSEVAKQKRTKVLKALENLQWVITNDNIDLKINPKKSYLGRITPTISIRNNSLIDFKKIYWEKGILSHDDVLFFSYHLIHRFPFITDVLVAKFPYIFIDEFQDSNPIQVEIIKKIAIKNTIIGVIGDVAQSIYEFQGADCTQFQLFNLPNLTNYVLEENRRSSNEIIDVLNFIREDISQTKFRNINKGQPIIFIGDMTLALREAKSICDRENVYTLSRNNITSNAMKTEISGYNLDNTLLERIKEIDSNAVRSKLIYSCIKAISYGKENKFKDAIKVLEKQFNYRNDKLKGRKKALKYITTLLEKYDEYKDFTLINFANFIRENLDSTLSNFRAGAPKTFYETYTLNQLSLCVSIPEDLSLHKTIHKSKGDEFNNVLLVLKQENDMNFLLNKDLSNDEEHRVNVSARATTYFIS
ncbi:UvrD-helicase domain-containing protein [Myroides sp.]|uniref:UvrD-helicase domain-containing protein n=1 Tax=Myroides sp. TaxID=1874736 RepID=UPI003F3897B0